MSVTVTVESAEVPEPKDIFIERNLVEHVHERRIVMVSRAVKGDRFEGMTMIGPTRRVTETGEYREHLQSDYKQFIGKITIEVK